MTPEQRRRTELNLVGGLLLKVTVKNGAISAEIQFSNRGELNTARRTLTGAGWHVITSGVTAQAMVKLNE